MSVSVPKKKKIPPATKKYQFQVNLPNNLKSYKSGNGEGIWAVPTTLKDFKIYQHGNKGDNIKVMILNDSFYFPTLSWGSVIMVEHRGDTKRPVMNKPLLLQLLAKSSKK